MGCFLDTLHRNTDLMPEPSEFVRISLPETGRCASTITRTCSTKSCRNSSPNPLRSRRMPHQLRPPVLRDDLGDNGEGVRSARTHTHPRRVARVLRHRNVMHPRRSHSDRGHDPSFGPTTRWEEETGGQSRPFVWANVAKEQTGGHRDPSGWCRSTSFPPAAATDDVDVLLVFGRDTGEGRAFRAGGAGMTLSANRGYRREGVGVRTFPRRNSMSTPTGVDAAGGPSFRRIEFRLMPWSTPPPFSISVVD